MIKITKTGWRGPITALVNTWFIFHIMITIPQKGTNIDSDIIEEKGYNRNDFSSSNHCQIYAKNLIAKSPAPPFFTQLFMSKIRQLHT